MSSVLKLPARFAFQAGSLSMALDAAIAEELHLSEGEEVELRAENGRIVIEAIRPEIGAPESDPKALEEEHRKRVVAATDHAMHKHQDLLALLAK